MDLTEKTIKSEQLYAGKVIQVFRDEVSLPGGGTSYRECVKHSGGVCVLAEVEGCILFVRQYRYVFQQLILELPAGKIDSGEDPHACGLRELKEETGFVANKLESLGVCYPSTGYTNEKIYLYYAEELSQGEPCLDADEFLDVIKIPTGEVKRMLAANEFVDAKTQIALLKYFA